MVPRDLKGALNQSPIMPKYVSAAHWIPRLEKLTLNVRKTSVFRHNGGLIKGSPRTPRHDSALMYGGFRCCFSVRKRLDKKCEKKWKKFFQLDKKCAPCLAQPHPQRYIFQILLNQTEIRLYLLFSD